MQPRVEIVHWLFATGFLILGLLLVAETVVGAEVWRRRAWRRYAWPTLAFALGLLLWPVTVWRLTSAAALLVSGAAFPIHEQNPWLFSRAAFLHHALGWTAIGAAVFPVGEALRPRVPVFRVGFALTFVAFAVLLYADRDAAPIFGHLSEQAR